VLEAREIKSSNQIIDDFIEMVEIADFLIEKNLCEFSNYNFSVKV
jgi:hypothetical protein